MRPSPAVLVAEAQELLDWYIGGFRETHRRHFPNGEFWTGIRLRHPALLPDDEDEIAADLRAAHGQTFEPLEGPEVLEQPYQFMYCCPLYHVRVSRSEAGLQYDFAGISDFPPQRFGDGSNTLLVRLPCASGIPERCVHECTRFVDQYFGHDPDEGPLPFDWSLRLLHFNDYIEQFG